MSDGGLSIVILGLSITSSWGNGHATTYRGLVRALDRRGHRVTFLERDVPWYAAHRDLPRPPYGRTALYGGLEELDARFGRAVEEADLVVVGSFVPEGIAVGGWVLDRARGVSAFYDIDTPVTLEALRSGACAYLSPEMIPRYGLYLSFTGGPTLGEIESAFGSPAARPLFCSVDPDLYFPERTMPDYDLGYLGTYSPDRQETLERLLVRPARDWPQGRFVVAGPQYPAALDWPANVDRVEHLPPPEHRRFYNRLRYALNVTRAPMVAAGHSPSVRLFEAAACGTPVISDPWEGLDRLFAPGEEILVAATAEDVVSVLKGLPEEPRRRMGERARRRVLAAHTAEHRAVELEGYVREAAGTRRVPAASATRDGGAGRRAARV